MGGTHSTSRTGDKCLQIGTAKVRDYFQESGGEGSIYIRAS